MRNTYYLMTDAVSSVQPHQYTWQLHGYGLENGTAAQGTFTDNFSNHKGTWQKNGVSLLAHVTATNGASAYQKSTSQHEITYNTTQDHTVMQVQKSNAAKAEFLSVLYPYVNTTPVVTTLSASGAAAIELQDGSITDVAFAQTDTVPNSVQAAALPVAVNSDALFTFFSVDAMQEPAQIFLQQGTSFSYGSQQLIRSDKRVDVAWQQADPYTVEGYVSRATTLTFRAADAPALVSGQHVQSWQHHAVQQELTVVFSGASDFSIQKSSNPLPVELVSFKAIRQN
ncbi:MAG: hypothetical protein LPK19_14975 [Hymenobacteraceae bacterium]|nr:hypothetical protein [Hymenobacteraceae bacterium]MDX5397537.1 hypothetical protein [Hymenobacteraceae bacterium]MDX5513615.1 hypothetical protein [Hymenobacteraceae bacterium]